MFALVRGLAATTSLGALNTFERVAGLQRYGVPMIEDEELERRVRQLEHDHKLTRWYTG